MIGRIRAAQRQKESQRGNERAKANDPRWTIDEYNGLAGHERHRYDTKGEFVPVDQDVGAFETSDDVRNFIVEKARKWVDLDGLPKGIDWNEAKTHFSRILVDDLVQKSIENENRDQNASFALWSLGKHKDLCDPVITPFQVDRLVDVFPELKNFALQSINTWKLYMTFLTRLVLMSPNFKDTQHIEYYYRYCVAPLKRYLEREIGDVSSPDEREDRLRRAKEAMRKDVSRPDYPYPHPCMDPKYNPDVYKFPRKYMMSPQEIANGQQPEELKEMATFVGGDYFVKQEKIEEEGDAPPDPAALVDAEAGRHGRVLGATLGKPANRGEWRVSPDVVAAPKEEPRDVGTAVVPGVTVEDVPYEEEEEIPPVDDDDEGDGDREEIKQIEAEEILERDPGNKAALNALIAAAEDAAMSADDDDANHEELLQIKAKAEEILERDPGNRPAELALEAVEEAEEEDGDELAAALELSMTGVNHEAPALPAIAAAEETDQRRRERVEKHTIRGVEPKTEARREKQESERSAAKKDELRRRRAGRKEIEQQLALIDDAPMEIAEEEEINKEIERRYQSELADDAALSADSSGEEKAADSADSSDDAAMSADSRDEVERIGYRDAYPAITAADDGGVADMELDAIDKALDENPDDPDAIAELFRLADADLQAQAEQWAAQQREVPDDGGHERRQTLRRLDRAKKRVQEADLQRARQALEKARAVARQAGDDGDAKRRLERAKRQYDKLRRRVTPGTDARHASNVEEGTADKEDNIRQRRQARSVEEARLRLENAMKEAQRIRDEELQRAAEAAVDPDKAKAAQRHKERVEKHMQTKVELKPQQPGEKDRLFRLRQGFALKTDARREKQEAERSDAKKDELRRARAAASRPVTAAAARKPAPVPPPAEPAPEPPAAAERKSTKGKEKAAPPPVERRWEAPPPRKSAKGKEKADPPPDSANAQKHSFVSDWLGHNNREWTGKRKGTAAEEAHKALGTAIKKVMDNKEGFVGAEGGLMATIMGKLRGWLSTGDTAKKPEEAFRLTKKEQLVLKRESVFKNYLEGVVEADENTPPDKKADEKKRRVKYLMDSAYVLNNKHHGVEYPKESEEEKKEKRKKK